MITKVSGRGSRTRIVETILKVSPDSAYALTVFLVRLTRKHFESDGRIKEGAYW